MKRATRTRSGYSRPATLLALCGVVVGSAATSSFADPDGKKLATRPASIGPSFIGGQWINSDGSPAPAPTSPVDNQGVTLLSQVTLGQFTTLTGASQTNASDCWGYTSPSGREYALIGLQRGFAFVEITNPSTPTLVEYHTGANSLWHDIDVVGDFAYGVSEGGLGVQVFDMTNIDNGVVTHVQNKQQGGHSSTHTIIADPVSGYLYCNGANVANGGLFILDAKTDPSNPTLVGTWTQRYVHECQAVTYTSGPYAGKEIVFASNTDRLQIIDVTNKSAPVVLSSHFYSNTGYTHQGWLSGDRQYFYLNDELDDQGGNTPSLTRIFNVANLSTPTTVGSFTSGENSIDHNEYWHNGFIFQSNYTSGLRVFEASNPLAPVQIAWYDTSPLNGLSFDGLWGNYPFFPSGTVIGSDLQGGLFVFEVDAVTSGVLNITFSGATPSQLQPQTPTSISADVKAFNTTVVSSTVELNVSVDGGAPSQYAMTLVSGDTYEGDIPGLPCYSDVEYWVTADSAAGNSYSGAPATASVFTGVNTTFSDNFETNTGWTATVSGATSGAWQRGVPVNDPGWEYDPASDSDGSGQCYLTENANGNTDVDSGSVTLISPTLDMTASNLSVSYDYFINMTDPANVDRLRVEVNNNNGVGTWTIIKDHPSGNGLNWNTHAFTADDLAAVGVTPTATMKVRFTANDSNPQSIVEAGLDAVKVSSVVCENACYADCDGSGALDFFDFLCYQNEFSAGNAYADCDGSGGLDFFDFLCFQNEFAAGCP